MSKLTGSKKATQFTESVIREMTRLNELYGGVNLSQGFPDFPGAGGDQGGGVRRDQRRRQPVRGDVGRAAAARSGRARVHAPLRPAGRRRRAGHGVLRLDRSDDGDDDGDHRSGRRGGDLRAVLRELRPRRDPLGRDAALRHAARAGASAARRRKRLVVRSRRARGGVQRQDEGDHHQHAEQPDRQGVLARRARDDRDALPQVGRDRDLRRDLRAHHLRRPPAHPDRDARGHGRAHGHDQRPVEDLQRDRLARGLDDLAAVADRRDPQGARLPDRRRRRRRCRKPARSRSACPTTTTPSSPPATSSGATCCSTSSSATTSPATSRSARTTS